MKIESISEVTDFKFNKDIYGTYDGYEIELDTKTIRILISNVVDCCESFGTICSSDSFKDFIDSNVLSFRCIDNAGYNDIPLFKKIDGFIDVLDCAFVNFETNKGTLQFAVYNNHNGYYGHEIFIQEIDK